jgi:hypothetical protein
MTSNIQHCSQCGHSHREGDQYCVWDPTPAESPDVITRAEVSAADREYVRSLERRVLILQERLDRATRWPSA